MVVHHRSKKRPSEGKHGAGDDGSQQAPPVVSRIYRLFGFEWQDFSSWDKFVKLMNRPTDPSSLGLTRLLFGLLMVVDIPQERGLSHADYKWGDTGECRFPLFNFLEPLPLQWMYVVYLVMLLGAVGIMLGLFYRLSCVMFIATYWYIFMLDKTVWNNHSYLYGLTGIMLLFCDANRYCSLDGLRKPKIRNSHVPLWNYCLLRAQFFLVYFIAGLKKLDRDWVEGYSMNELSKHWVFMPFTQFLDGSTVDLWIVHRGGLFIDMFIGYFLFFDVTRPFAMFFGMSFHCMNSQIFNIGMFPYVMMATMPLFCHVDWPRKLVKRLPDYFRSALPYTDDPEPSNHCLYTKQQIKPEPEEPSSASGDKARSIPSDKIRFYHKFSTVFVILYLAIQMFLPYSHFLTKGYNNWTNGLYGYSWDMMVHSWSTQHVRITYVNKDTQEVGYLNPEAWTRSKRWNSHADMLKQHAMCIKERLREHDIHNVELYFDVWRSLNDRFQQRMFDPRVDLVEAEWHPFEASPWVMPLLTDLSDWRAKLDQLEKTIYNQSNDTDVVFIADFPGLALENYVQEDLGNTTITILKGEVIVELPDLGKNFTLKEGQDMKLPPGQYHNVHTISDSPSCYMYIFINTTEIGLAKDLDDYELRVQAGEQHKSGVVGPDGTSGNVDDKDSHLAQVYEQIKAKRMEIEINSNTTTWQKFSKFVRHKYHNIARGVSLTGVALKSIVTGKPFEEVFNATIGAENDIWYESI